MSDCVSTIEYMITYNETKLGSNALKRMNWICIFSTTPPSELFFSLSEFELLEKDKRTSHTKLFFFERSGKNFASCDESHIVNSPEACFDSNKTEFVIHARTKFYSR